MEDAQKKKKSDFVCWLALIVLIVWAIIQHPMLIFGVIAFIGLWYDFKGSSPKSPGTNEKEETAEEEDPNFNRAAPKSDEKEGDFVVAGEKTDSFYSGISESSSIDKKGDKL